jgi:hypothetical protein
MVLDNYHQDRLTLSEVSGYLGLKVKHVPRLEELLRIQDDVAALIIYSADGSAFIHGWHVIGRRISDLCGTAWAC